MTEFIDKRHNGALNANPDIVNGQRSDINITVRGSDWYWAVCAVMTVSAFVFLGLGIQKPRTDRIFHYITAGITMIAAIAYFSMASNLGWTPIMVEFQRSDHRVAGRYREIFYAVLPALVYIVYMLAWEARLHAKHIGPDVGRTFMMCSSLTLVVWIAYPIAWGVCEGGNIIAPDSEAVFYGILDLIAKPIFGALLLWGHRNIGPARLGLRIRDIDERTYPDGPSTKNAPVAGQAALRNGTATATGANVNPNA
ncbi:hypothetical protein F53441_11769 [Fusarium austroafricanum]|uniref:Opsin-1 n=1 Tax=Fusarium austroafricanum TaxID=2364996 RepID=A0A8H4K2S8_9HYPO|nr:hypothetical protein F53441_11769 [Fusarium austroafricanum]